MSILVVAEHDNNAVDPSTLKTLAAAQKIGGDIEVLVAERCSTVAENVASGGVKKVMLADNDAYEHQLAENISELVADLGKTTATFWLRQQPPEKLHATRCCVIRQHWYLTLSR